MASIGSVFLGDVQRVRLRSSGSTPASTPPSSPPPTQSLSRPGPPQEQEHHLAPTQSLQLRLRWLEALIYGAKHESLAGLHERKPDLKRGETLLRAAEHAHRRMNDVASAHDALRKFISQCEPPPHFHRRSTNFLRTDDQHAQYLTPAFALSGTLPTIAPPEYVDMSPSELAALAAELEPDIRAADNDMREIASLQQRGVTGAGTLSGTRVPFNSYANINPQQTTKLCGHDSRPFCCDTKRISCRPPPSRSASPRSSGSMPYRCVSVRLSPHAHPYERAQSHAGRRPLRTFCNVG